MTSICVLVVHMYYHDYEVCCCGTKAIYFEPWNHGPIALTDLLPPENVYYHHQIALSLNINICSNTEKRLKHPIFNNVQTTDYNM